MRLPILTCLLLATALAGCRDNAEPPQPTADAAAPAADPVPAPAMSAPAATDAAATPGDIAPVEGSGPGAGMLPAPGTLTYKGFGPAAFGATEEEVRMAWGKDMTGAPGEPGGCYLLVPAPGGQAASPLRFGFMLEGDKFARVDVRIDAIAAPGGGKVGMPAAEIQRLYPGAQASPHKYVEGARTLRVKDPAGSNAALVFETDATGTVGAWRIGVPPQVDYVETCG